MEAVPERAFTTGPGRSGGGQPTCLQRHSTVFRASSRHSPTGGGFVGDNSVADAALAVSWLREQAADFRLRRWPRGKGLQMAGAVGQSVFRAHAATRRAAALAGGDRLPRGGPEGRRPHPTLSQRQVLPGATRTRGGGCRMFVATASLEVRAAVAGDVRACLANARQERFDRMVAHVHRKTPHRVLPLCRTCAESH
jgi:hypothetical protein